MNKPQILLANKGLRVDESETGGVGQDFDPMSVLSNTKAGKVIENISEPPVEDVLMS